MRFALAAACMATVSVAVGPDAPAEWHVVFEDSFDRDTLGDGWRVVDGAWEVRDGALHGRGFIVIDSRFEGLQRLEATVAADEPGDLTPVLHSAGTSLAEGYFLQFAGFNNTYNQARRQWMPIGFDDTQLARAGTRHHLVAEFDGQRARLTVDGATVHDYPETDFELVDGGATTAGLFLHRPGRIEEVRLYTRPFDPGTARAVPGPGPTPQPDDNLLLGGAGENPLMFMRWDGPVKRTTKDAHRGTGALKLDRIASVTSPNFIPIDPDATYEVSGVFRSAQPGQPSRVLLDLRFYTADKRSIGPHAVQPISGVGRVIGDVPAGATKLRIAAADWPTNGVPPVLALNAAEDLSDLPNFDTHVIERVEATGEAMVVTLREPLAKSVPAGTGVRLHRYLDFARVWDNRVPETWKRYAFVVSPTPPAGAPPQMRIWPGAAFARVVIFNHYTHYPKPLPGGEPTPILFFDDIAVRRIGDGER